MSIATVSANDVLTSTKVNEIINGINGVKGPFQYKPADETISSNATYQADDHMVVPVEAGKIYVARLHINYSASTVADYRCRLQGPAGATAPAWTMFGTQVSPPIDIPDMFIGSAGIPASGTGNIESLDCFGIIIISSTPGNITVQWAQNASEATNTTTKLGSFLFLEEAA